MAERSSSGIVWLVAALIVAMLIAGGIGATALYRTWNPTEVAVVDAGSVPDPETPRIGQRVEDAAAPEEPFDPVAAEAAMRRRYRPGPRVQTVGLLPGGRLREAHVRNTQRTGHTISNPFIVAGGELRAGAPPAPSAPGPSIRLGAAESADPLTLLPNVPASVTLHASPASPDAPVSGLVVWFEGYQGYFFLPATVDTELGHMQVAGLEEARMHFGVDTPTRPDGTLATADKGPFDVMMHIASVDVGGHVSPSVPRSLRVYPVGTGDVRVALSMTAATDLDLYVIDPSGHVIYYGETTSPTGGQLDLDANAGCGSNMGVNNEHVFWPTGMAPAGTYTVRVSNYSSCINGAKVDYRITVENCGEVAIFSGTMDGPGDSEGCQSPPAIDSTHCQEAVQFEVTPCDPNAAKPPV